MTYQECIWMNWVVMPVSIQAKSGYVHRYIRPFVGKTGYVVKEAKNGMLLIRFHYKKKGWKVRAIPASCLMMIKLDSGLADPKEWLKYEEEMQ